MFFGSFIENLLNYTIPMYKNNGAIQSMWDNLQNKWGSIFTINANDECIEYFGIWFSFLLWRLECCGVNSYDDWRGLSSPEQQADCFLPLSCDNSYNYRREKLPKNNLSTMEKVEINFSSSDGVATNSSKSLFLCLEATTKVFEEVKYIKHSQNL